MQDGRSSLRRFRIQRVILCFGCSGFPTQSAGRIFPSPRPSLTSTHTLTPAPGSWGGKTDNEEETSVSPISPPRGAQPNAAGRLERHDLQELRWLHIWTWALLAHERKDVVTTRRNPPHIIPIPHGINISPSRCTHTKKPAATIITRLFHLLLWGGRRRGGGRHE